MQRDSANSVETTAAPNGYQRISAAPQVSPPPMASSSTRSPALDAAVADRRPSASGTEAAEVLPCSATVEITFSGGMPSLRAGAVENALVGLMGHEPVDLRDLPPRLRAAGVDGLGDIGHRMPEDFMALHAQVAGRAGRRDGRRRHRADRASRPSENKLGAEHAAIAVVALALARLKHHRARRRRRTGRRCARSVQSIRRDMVSAPITRTVLAWPALMKLSATASA